MRLSMRRATSGNVWQSTAADRKWPSATVAIRTASSPLPRTSPMMMRTAPGELDDLVQIAADQGRRGRTDVLSR